MVKNLCITNFFLNYCTVVERYNIGNSMFAQGGVKRLKYHFKLSFLSGLYIIAIMKEESKTIFFPFILIIALACEVIA